MTSLYHHTQIGYTIIFPLLMVCVILITLAPSPPPEIFFPLFAVGAVLVIGVFSSLTIELTETHFMIRMGIGIFRKRIPLSEIITCTSTHRFLPIFGFHLTLRGWVFHVSGFTFVEITYKNGRHLFLGSDEAEDVCIALRKAISQCSQDTLQRVRAM
jgi:hypothetical protein